MKKLFFLIIILLFFNSKPILNEKDQALIRKIRNIKNLSQMNDRELNRLGKAFCRGGALLDFIGKKDLIAKWRESGIPFRDYYWPNAIDIYKDQGQARKVLVSDLRKGDIKNIQDIINLKIEIEKELEFLNYGREFISIFNSTVDALSFNAILDMNPFYKIYFKIFNPGKPFRVNPIDTRIDRLKVLQALAFTIDIQDGELFV